MKIKFKFKSLALAIATSSLYTAAWAQMPNSSEIADRLAVPKSTNTTDQIQTRSIFGGPNSRGITVTNSKQDDLPAIDLNILFEFDSSKLTTDGSVLVGNLGRALKDQRLSGNKFRVEGHTDSKGADSYNQNLSERRADSVKRELIAVHGIDASRVESIGLGKRFLLDQINPESASNRRVRIINLGVSQ